MLNEQIIIGSLDSPSYSFDENSLESVTCENSIGLTGGEMSADVLEFAVFYNDPSDRLADVPYATPVYYYSNGRPVGKYYILSVEQTGTSRYSFRATSLIGIIESEKFYGGMYNGDRFDSVVSKVLMGDGVSPDYEIVYAQNSDSNTYSVKVGDAADSLDQYKYRLHINFQIVSTFAQISSGGWTASTIAGTRNLYDITLYAAKDSDTGLISYWIELYYGPTTPSGQRKHIDDLFKSDKLIGNGSTVDIDVDPVNGRFTAVVNYVKPGDPSTTGTIEYEEALTLPTTTSSSEKVNLYFALGTSVRSYSSTVGGYICSSTNYDYFALKWNAYEVYNENGEKVVDAVYAKRDGTNYICNAITGIAVNAQPSQYRSWNTVGATIGYMSSLDKYSRLVELNGTISYNEGVAALPVFGWIPIGTRREALHQLLFALGISMVHSADGGIVFTSLSSTASGEISSDNLYDNGSEERIRQAKTVSVTEHTFSEPDGDAETLFDNSQSELRSGEYIAELKSAPVYGTLTGSGGITIVYSNCNAAVVTGRGIITGTPYVHSKNAITYINGNVSDGSDVAVSDATLVSSINSDNVLNRLKAYYCADIRKTCIGIKFDGERCGAVYSFTSPLQRIISAFLTKYTSRASSFVRSECEFIRGFTPQKGGGYSSFAIVTYGSSFTIPEEVKQQPTPTVRLNIIGTGGDGTAGANGESGERAESTQTWPTKGAKGGAGGEGGEGGAGGSFLAVSLNVANITTVTVEQSGKNTVVKAYNGSTLVSTYSSATGTSQESGFVNVFTGIAYALPGNKGIDGGAGGEGGWVERGGTLKDGTNGENAGNYVGGITLPGIDYSEYYQPVWYTVGGGGGASGGSNGGNAWYDNPQYTYGGDGADGGSPVPTSPIYGCGGNGGNGGGGGGGSGVRVVQWDSSGSASTYPMTQGQGGTGGAGGEGYPGCLIIYY